MLERKISTTAFSLSSGILTALHLGGLALLAVLGYGGGVVNLVGELLPGYDISGAGIFLGMTWGFIIGSVYGGVFAFFYNKMK
jgi:hypothetical protein